MKRLHLQRLTRTDYATYGQFSDEENRLICCTLERPWLDNQHDVSCIPAGTYGAHRYLSPKRGYEVFMLDGVPNRDAIEIHIANLPSELLGCIAVGMHFGEVTTARGESGYGVLESKAAFTALMNRLAGELNVALAIEDPAPSVRFEGEDGG